jgi:hypothetical protein
MGDRARRLLSSPDYKKQFKARLLGNSLPPQLEVLLYYYAYGKPVEQLTVGAEVRVIQPIDVFHVGPGD